MQRLSRISRYLENNSGNLAGAFFTFGIVFTLNISKALSQGAGLHGYLIIMKAAGSGSNLPVWNFVVADFVAFSASLAFFIIWLHFKRLKTLKRTLSDNANLQERTVSQ